MYATNTFHSIIAGEKCVGVIYLFFPTNIIACAACRICNLHCVEVTGDAPGIYSRGPIRFIETSPLKVATIHTCIIENVVI